MLYLKRYLKTLSSLPIGQYTSLSTRTRIDKFDAISLHKLHSVQNACLHLSVVGDGLTLWFLLTCKVGFCKSPVRKSLLAGYLSYCSNTFGPDDNLLCQN